MVLRAILFDRDGTLIRDVPYNADPEKVVVLPTVGEAIDLCRRKGVSIGVVTNQSGVGRGYMTSGDVGRVNRRVESRLGTFDTWQICFHAPSDGCTCRKPMPGLVLQACRDLGLQPREVAVIGDRLSDAQAALNAGSQAVMVGCGPEFPFIAEPTVLEAVKRLVAEDL